MELSAEPTTLDRIGARLRALYLVEVAVLGKASELNKAWVLNRQNGNTDMARQQMATQEELEAMAQIETLERLRAAELAEIEGGK